MIFLRNWNYVKNYIEEKGKNLDKLRLHAALENEENQIIATMILNPQKDIFEIEDFHIKSIRQNKEVLEILKVKLLEYLKTVQTEIICNMQSLCPQETSDDILTK